MAVPRDSFYTQDELNELGFQALGENVKLSRKCSIYGAGRISIGNNVRIDDFCILSGLITLGNNVHIAAYVALYGGDSGIYIDDFGGVSSRTCVYAASDDYSGEAMTNPTIPDQYRHVISAPVYMERHVLIGTTCVVLPGVRLREGSSFGGFSLINHDSEEWSMNVGIPFKKMKERSKKLLQLEKEYKDACL